MNLPVYFGVGNNGFWLPPYICGLGVVKGSCIFEKNAETNEPVYLYCRTWYQPGFRSGLEGKLILTKESRAIGCGGKKIN